MIPRASGGIWEAGMCFPMQWRRLKDRSLWGVAWAQGRKASRAGLELIQREHLPTSLAAGLLGRKELRVGALLFPFQVTTAGALGLWVTWTLVCLGRTAATANYLKHCCFLSPHFSAGQPQNPLFSHHFLV